MLTGLSHLLYSTAWWLVLPVALARLWWRGRREPGYREHVGERLGRYRKPPQGPLIWIHAVSVGETRAAAALIEAVRRSLPDATILLTHMTAAGRATGRTLFGDMVTQAWLPYDVPFAVNAFFRHFRPGFGLLLETEVWPNCVAAAKQHGVPLFLVNARLSERSARGYARWRSLTHPAFAGLTGVAAQAPPDARRLEALGAPQPIVTGNLKFDFPVSDRQIALGAALRERFGRSRPVWMAASTRDGEEALILDAIANAALPANSLLLLVPRHPQRFDQVARLVAARGLRCVRRSADEPVTRETSVVVGDSMGEMIAYYACADVALIGGSLLPLGGQNLIEAMAVSRPVVVGPHMFNFAEVTAAAVAAGAALQASDAGEAVRAVGELLRDGPRRRRMGEAGHELWRTHRGATDRTWRWLAQCLGPAFGQSRTTPAGDPAADQ